MTPEEAHAWLLSRSKATQRFVKFGGFAWLAAFAIVTLQYLIWTGAGWGAATFLPGWCLVLVYLTSSLIAISAMYHIVVLTAFQGKIRWGAAAMVGTIAGAAVMTALAHSLPQLSTLIISLPSETRLQIYKSRFDPIGPGYKLYCPNSISFGPFYSFRGGWCGVYLPKGETYTFEGHGHAWAMRLNSVQR